jgi:hypothetical protein
MIDEALAGNTASVMRAMDWERRHRTDPGFRADHFVKTWRALGDQYAMFERRGDERAAQRIAATMAGLASSPERNPQLESLLRQRIKALGLTAYLDRPLSQSLPDWIGRGRGRGLGR